MSSAGVFFVLKTPLARSAALKIGPDAPASNVRSRSINAAPRELETESVTLAGYYLAYGKGPALWRGLSTVNPMAGGAIYGFSRADLGEVHRDIRQLCHTSR